MKSTRTLAVLTSDPDGPVLRHRFLAYREALAAREIALEIVPWPKDGAARKLALARIEASEATVISSRLLARKDVTRVRAAARRLGFDFDDALPFRDSQHGATRSRTRTARFERIVGVADRVTAGNDVLAALAERDVTVLPTTVVCAPAPAPLPDDGEIVAGWIGSRATLPYLAALDASWPADMPVRLRVVADAAPALARVPVEHVAWDADTWQEALQGIHFGVAPLPDDPWTRGKCGLKVLQMMALGRAVVASPVGVQAQQVQDDVTGFLPATPAAFSACIEKLARDDGLRTARGIAAHAAVRDAWSVQAWSQAFCDEVEALLA